MLGGILIFLNVYTRKKKCYTSIIQVSTLKQSKAKQNKASGQDGGTG